MFVYDSRHLFAGSRTPVGNRHCSLYPKGVSPQGGNNAACLTGRPYMMHHGSVHRRIPAGG